MRDARFRLSPVAAMVAAALAPQAASALTTFTVTNTADSGAGSLRQALADINADCTLSPFDIVFAIPGTGPFVLTPASPYPNLNCASNPLLVSIDGYTQAGSSPNTSSAGWNAVNLIHIQSAFAFSPGCGLQMSDPSGLGSRLTVKGLEVRNFTYGGVSQGICGYVSAFGNVVQGNSSGFGLANGAVIGSLASDADRNIIIGNTGYGIDVAYGGNITVENNFIGTQDGSTAVPNGNGVHLPGAVSTVTGNLISGNTGFGIVASNDNGSTISSNRIGTNVSATAALPNAGGVSGSTLSATNISGNIISGNTGNAIALQSVSGVTVSGNKIGLDITGNAAIANGSDGFFAQCGSGMTVTGNNFSGNVANGVTIAGVDNVAFTGNRVGVSAGGSPLANGDSGVLLAAGACLQYGSNGVFSGNMILNNGVDGIALTSPQGVGNRITQNSIHANGNKNININNTVGPLPNDAGDADGGPNSQQNYPVITLVTQSGGNTLANWTFNSTPSSTFSVEVFKNPAAGTPAGLTFLTTFAVTTDASGNASGTQSISGLHDFISMTATNTGSSTSEFSAIVAVTPTPGVTITPPALNFGNVVVNTTSASQSSTLTSSGTANYQISTFDTAATCYGAPLCYGGPFICSTNCATTPTSYAPSQSCTITASFSPTVLGPQAGTIYICDNALGSPHTITLSGTAVAPPPIAVNPASQDFGSVAVGGASLPILFNFSNPGTAPAPISPPQVTGPFQITSTNCGTSIPQFSSCNVSVSFTPASAGLASGTLSMQSGASTVTAGLAGTGTVSPILVLPPPIDFGGVLVGSTVTRTIPLTNSGGGPLNFSSITVTAPFTLTNACPATLQPGQSCSLIIGVDSSTVGSYTGTLTIVSDGGSGTVPLTANVQQLPIPILKISPTTVGFGDRVVGSTSASQRITILNEGGAAATITGITPGADWVITGNTCGTNLAPNATCFVDVALRAVGFGGRVGELVIASNATGAPHAVRLAGTGCRPFSATGVRTGPRSNCR